MKSLRQLFDPAEREHAFSRRQLRNHALHAVIGLLAYSVVRWGLGLHPVHAFIWVLALGATKEYAETILKSLRGRYIWILDSLLDLAGWLAPALLLAGLLG